MCVPNLMMFLIISEIKKFLNKKYVVHIKLLKLYSIFTIELEEKLKNQLVRTHKQFN